MKVGKKPLPSYVSSFSVAERVLFSTPEANVFGV